MSTGVGAIGGGGLPLGTSLSCCCGEGFDLEVVEGDQAEVELGVVVAAEEVEVVDDGFAAFCPGDEVVDIAPFG